MLSQLPISPLLSKIEQTLATHPVLVLQAPPGAGKTTCVPLALLKANFLAGQSILMLEPRRLAASNAARFMAKQLGEDVGQRVGYSIRYQRKVSAATRIEVVTEGILARRLQNDPELSGVGLVIFDEFHERHLQSDLALALCRDIQLGLRDDLKILIMSATLDSDSLAEQLRAPLLTSAGRSFPVTTHYFPGKNGQTLVASCVAATRRALAETDGDILVFLPGEREIRSCCPELTNLESTLVCPLYSNLNFADQERAIRPAEQRKIVLATNIAETSLTIEGISVVIDSGYSRQPRFDAGSSLTKLKLGRISQASATQRAGRAGRLGPGDCYRLWGEGEHATLLPFTPPEIRTADLAPLVLDLFAWGVKTPNDLFWLDPPSATAWQHGIKLLDQLGALTQQRQLNPIGQQMATIPAHPRIARLLLAAKEKDLLELGCELAALLTEPDPWYGQTATRQSDSDLLDRLESFHRSPDSREFSAIARANRYWRRYFKLSTSAGNPTVAQLACLLAAAYPDRIGKARCPGDKRYLLSSGQGARLGDKSALQNAEYLIAVNLRAVRDSEAEISLASALSSEVLQQLFPQLPWQQHCYWDASEGRVIANQQQRLGELVINQRPIKPDGEQTQQAIFTAIRTEGLNLLQFDKKSRNLLARLRFLQQHDRQHSWPDSSDQALRESLENWLAPFLGTARNRGELQKIDLLSALKSRLDWQQLQRLDQLAPERLNVPSGSKIALQYPPNGAPILAVKLQEMFGQLDTPRIAAGQVAVVIHLLSPAGRPLQITQDLRHFWEQNYLEVKKEMKGRYPKHPWPDDPLTALPTAKTKRKLTQQEK